MTEMSSSADKVAQVQTALGLPVMLIAIPAGAIADLHDRRIVALISCRLGGHDRLGDAGVVGAALTKPPARALLCCGHWDRDVGARMTGRRQRAVASAGSPCRHRAQRNQLQHCTKRRTGNRRHH